jgi:hypothetical protein
MTSNIKPLLSTFQSKVHVGDPSEEDFEEPRRASEYLAGTRLVSQDLQAIHGERGTTVTRVRDETVDDD